MDFVTSLSVISGAAGIGAALDACAGPRYRTAFVQWIRNTSERQRDISLNGSALVDRVFGLRLFSRRAILVSIALSLASICVAYGIGIITTPAAMRADMFIFPAHPSFVDFVLLGICFLFAVGADVVSYAQSRLFIRAIDKARNGVVAIGMLIGDAVISLALFFVSFSFARMLCYIIVINVVSPPALARSEFYFPAIVQDFIEENEIDVPIGDALDATGFAYRLQSARTASDLSSLSTYYVDFHTNSRDGFSHLAYIDVSARASCMLAPDVHALDNTVLLLEGVAS